MKTLEECKSKFNNINHFNSFPNFKIEFKEKKINIDKNLQNILISNKGWGNMSYEQSMEWSKNIIFYCGICSKDVGVNIYHNIIGEHRHFNLLDGNFQDSIKNKVKELRNKV